ncbi:MAG: hypothetical protein R3C45_12090 [Phycisphaerales bacterium]
MTASNVPSKKKMSLLLTQTARSPSMSICCSSSPVEVSCSTSNTPGVPPPPASVSSNVPAKETCEPSSLLTSAPASTSSVADKSRRSSSASMPGRASRAWFEFDGPAIRPASLAETEC